MDKVIQEIKHNKFIQPTGNNAFLFSVPRFVAQRLMTALGADEPEWGKNGLA
jgi:hypothetical protein